MQNKKYINSYVLSLWYARWFLSSGNIKQHQILPVGALTLTTWSPASSGSCSFSLYRPTSSSSRSCLTSLTRLTLLVRLSISAWSSISTSCSCCSSSTSTNCWSLKATLLSCSCNTGTSRLQRYWQKDKYHIHLLRRTWRDSL